MSKTVVRCSECGKQLFLTDTPEDNRGKIAAEVQHRGCIAKLPALYGHGRFEFFCCKECKDKWFAKIPEDVRQKGDKAYRQLSDTMKSEDFQRGLQEGLAKISEIYKKFRKR